MRHRLALIAALAAATICGGGRAVAQLAVTDTAREATETSIADCMTKVNASKHQEVAPSQGVTGSMVSPGQGATVSSAGQTVVSGVGTPVSTGTVSGMNLSAAIPSLSGMVATTSTGQLNLNAVAQVLASLTGANKALSSNQTGLNATSAVIGFLSPAQGAWNQNSGARVNNASIWNQYIQLATLTAQLLNQKNLNGIASASAASGFLNYNPAAAILTNGALTSNTNATVTPIANASFSSVAQQLAALQAAAAAAGGGALISFSWVFARKKAMSKKRFIVAVAATLVLQNAALAQVPVIDAATLTQATTTAANTAAIMASNQQILTTVQKTLTAVTGNRSTSALSSIASGGFSMSSIPSLSSLLGGGTLSMGGLGSFGSMASTIINGLNLVKSLTGSATASTNATDVAYVGALNTAAALTAAIAGAQSASTTRSSSFTTAAGTIGTAADIKGSIDANSQLQVQTGQTINELIGAVNLTNSALNAAAQQDLAAQSKVANMFTYSPTAAVLTTAPTTTTP